MSQDSTTSGDLSSARYVSLTTYRRDATAVATPVWQVSDGGYMWVWTRAGTGKAKRLRNNSALTVAPCSGGGTPTGPAVAGRGVVIPADTAPAIGAKLRQKYGYQLPAIRCLHWFQHRILRRPVSGYVLIRISADSGPQEASATGDEQ